MVDCVLLGTSPTGISQPLARRVVHLGGGTFDCRDANPSVRETAHRTSFMRFVDREDPL